LKSIDIFQYIGKLRGMVKKALQNTRMLGAAQLRVLASPVRIEIVGALQAYGSMAIRELAEKLARPADGLYHHVRELEKAGIVRIERTQRTGKRDEAVYALTAERFGQAQTSTTPAMKEAIIEAAGAVLRLAGREVRRAVLIQNTCDPREASATSKSALALARLSRQRSWLTPRDLKVLQARLDAIDRFLKKRMRHKQGAPFALTVALVPLVKRKRV
jgi:DNA-binding transcriptional ArsR family regulator